VDAETNLQAMRDWSVKAGATPCRSFILMSASIPSGTTCETAGSGMPACTWIMLLSPALAGQLKQAEVDRAVRGEANASDHAPVWAELRYGKAEHSKAVKKNGKMVPNQERRGTSSVRSRNHHQTGAPPWRKHPKS
jgi:hypothetical protein